MQLADGMQAQRTLDSLLPLETSDSVAFMDGEIMTQLIRLDLPSTTTLHVIPQDDTFAVKLGDFDLWMTKEYAVLRGERVDFQMNTYFQLILMKLEHNSRLVVRDHEGATVLSVSSGKVESFSVQFLGYGIVSDGESATQLEHGNFTFLDEHSAPEAFLILLNY